MTQTKANKEQQQGMVKNILRTVCGPAVPPVYRTFMAPWPWSPFFTALFTPPFFKFLVGPNRWALRNDEALGGVYVERCRFLEETGCKVCPPQRRPSVGRPISAAAAAPTQETGGLCPGTATRPTLCQTSTDRPPLGNQDLSLGPRGAASRPPPPSPQTP